MWPSPPHCQRRTGISQTRCQPNITCACSCKAPVVGAPMGHLQPVIKTSVIVASEAFAARKLNAASRFSFPLKNSSTPSYSVCVRLSPEKLPPSQYRK
eukprot:scaffold49_cov409-Prasinococcus_capsulatus_cf.AAC.18